MTQLRRIRESKGFSQRQLAQFAGIAQANLCAAERGKLILWPKARKALSAVLGVPEEKLFPEKTVGEN